MNVNLENMTGANGMFHTLLDDIENFFNWISDMDASWWPFVALRPAKDETFTTLRYGLLMLAYVVPTGMVLFLLTGDLTWPFAMQLMFVVTFPPTFGVCWNRRAERLQAEGRARTLRAHHGRQF
jgi:hypothetical protein